MDDSETAADERDEQKDARCVHNLASDQSFSLSPTSSSSASLSSSDKTKPSANSPLTEASSFSGVSAAIDAFETKKRVNNELETGCIKFNLQPKVGLAYLRDRGHLGDFSAATIARFLHEWGSDSDDREMTAFSGPSAKRAWRLDKTAIGEFLGREPSFMAGLSTQVLHEYAAQTALRGLPFDVAIRSFLAGFRLPGEAQKIDRIMEKFAERFCAENTSAFRSPDVAFVLAFSVIMLNTDLHNKAIQEDRRMSKEGFLRNNRGIDGDQDLAPEFLSAIYDNIKAEPIALREDDDQRRRDGQRNETKPLVLVSSRHTPDAPPDANRYDSTTSDASIATGAREAEPPPELSREERAQLDAAFAYLRSDAADLEQQLGSLLIGLRGQNR